MIEQKRIGTLQRLAFRRFPFYEFHNLCVYFVFFVVCSDFPTWILKLRSFGKGLAGRKLN